MFTVTAKIEVTLTEDELAYAVAYYYRLNKEGAKKYFDRLVEVDGEMGCPFPSMCNRFPCKTLRCNGSNCIKGCVY